MSGPLLARIAAAHRGGGSPSDPYWSNVVSLLHFDGANGSTAFTDQKGKVWTATNGAVIDTSKAKFGAASGNFAAGGANASIGTASSSDFAFGTGDFTVEGWVQPAPGGNTVRYLCDIGPTASGLVLFINASGQLAVYCYGDALGGLNTAGPVASTSRMTAVSLSRVDNVMYAAADGVVWGSVTNTRSFAAGSAAYGNQLSALAQFANANLDEWRITKGVGRYTANYTPAIAPFPDH